MRNARIGLVITAVVFAAILHGCGKWKPVSSSSNPAVVDNAQAAREITGPLSLLLPKKVKIHPFTGTKTFEEHGGVPGIVVRIQLMDSYEDPTKAFGNFRFEIYEFRPHSQNPKGKKIDTWEESLMQPKKNLLHWDKITRAYKFKLRQNHQIVPGQKYVLVAVFSSQYSDRLFADRQFTSGQ